MCTPFALTLKTMCTRRKTYVGLLALWRCLYINYHRRPVHVRRARARPVDTVAAPYTLSMPGRCPLATCTLPVGDVYLLYFTLRVQCRVIRLNDSPRPNPARRPRLHAAGDGAGDPGFRSCVLRGSLARCARAALTIIDTIAS